VSKLTKKYSKITKTYIKSHSKQMSITTKNKKGLIYAIKRKSQIMSKHLRGSLQILTNKGTKKSTSKQQKQTKLSNCFEEPDFDLTKTTQQLQITNNQTKTKKKTTTNALTNNFLHFPLLTWQFFLNIICLASPRIF
jgi:hypothetical protein